MSRSMENIALSFQLRKRSTDYGRLIQKELQKISLEKYGLEIVFGFTDSIFIKNASLDAINRSILECKVSCNTRTQESIHKHDNI